jgi:cytosine/uracil/thiamine/allantoin permease
MFVCVRVEKQSESFGVIAVVTIWTTLWSSHIRNVSDHERRGEALIE